MVRIIAVSVALLSVAWICSARLQFMTFFTGTSYTGDSLTIQTNHVNTTYFMDFLRSAQSWKSLGFWRVSEFPNFGGMGFGINNGLVESGSPNFSFPYKGSIRHIGTTDLSIPAIWLYSHTSLLMDERIVTQPAANDFTFVPRSLVTTGRTSWTLFTGKNFDGVSTCLVSVREIEIYFSLNATLSNINSVIRGCVGRIDNYVHGGDEIGTGYDDWIEHK